MNMKNRTAYVSNNAVWDWRLGAIEIGKDTDVTDRQIG